MSFLIAQDCQRRRTIVYRLTLSRAERAAIDWVGNRYSHGDELYKELCLCNWEPEICFWDDPIDITFIVPENVAWAINELGKESEYRWDCFVNSLRSKLNIFCQGIV